MKAIPLIHLVFLACIARVDAMDYVVSNEKDFNVAVASAKPSDTIIFKNGTWPDVKLLFRGNGTPDRPITFRAETAGKTVFTGASQLTIDGSYLVASGFNFESNSNLPEVITPYNVSVASVAIFTTNANHCRLTETAIRNSGQGVSTFVHLRPGGISNRVDHCYFSNPGAVGVTFYVEVDPARPNYHQVDHNYFGDRKPGTGNRWETVRLGHSEQQNFVSETTVAYNYFYKCNGEIECISNKSTGNRFLYNSFIENRGQLTLRHGDKAWIEGNYFDGRTETASQGIRISGSDHVIVNNYFKKIRDAVIVYNGQDQPEVRGYTPVHNALIAYNTFEDCVNNLAIGIGGTGRTLKPRNLRLSGNLIQATSGRIVQMRTSGIDVRYENNLFFGAELGIEPVSGIETNRPSLTTDPFGRIVLTQSPVRPSKNLLTEAAVDANGNRRDIEGAGSISRVDSKRLHPLSQSDVGPTWMK